MHSVAANTGCRVVDSGGNGLNQSSKLGGEMNNHSKTVGQRLYGASMDGFSQILAMNAARQEE
jgi:hypothetical protein